MKRFVQAALFVWCIAMTAAAWAVFDEGLAAYNTGDYATALEKWRALAKQGDADAQNSLGVAYEKGNGVKQNYAEAVKLYASSAKQGNEAAQFNLGRMYAKGRGVKKSAAKAVYWYAKSAEQGNASAQNNLGLAYANGLGVPKNNVEAVKWFSLAAEQGQASAQSNLGWMYAHGHGVEKNMAEAAKWKAKAAAKFAPHADQNIAGAPVNRVKSPGASGVKPLRKAGKIFRDCKGCPEMRVIHAGSFDMGSPSSEAGHFNNEGPVHRVKIASFALGKTEITRGQFAAFVKETKHNAGGKCWTLDGGKFEERAGDWRKPGYKQDDRHPVACINWNDARAYARWLSRKTGKKYRLPTEAEWEYAARGDSLTARYWGDNPDAACAYANAADRIAQTKIMGATSWSVHQCTDGFAYTSPAGSFTANAFGLNDMLGNLWEWTEDGYIDNYAGAPTDGSAWQTNGAERVLRGGSWNNSPQDVRAAIRNMNDPGLRFSIFGFRLARSLP
jgi:formylglycine-generating enzyme required for sulfatase activity